MLHSVQPGLARFDRGADRRRSRRSTSCCRCARRCASAVWSAKQRL